MIKCALRIGGNDHLVVDDDLEHIIGRSSDATLRIDDERVGEAHAVLGRRATGWVLEDRGSAGGTWFHGQRIDELAIDAPVTVHLGDPDGPVLTLTPLAERVGSSETAESNLRRPVGGHFASTPLAGVLRIGRSPGNDIVVNDLLVSKHHAELRRSTDGRLDIIDLGSRYGTFVNGVARRRTIVGEGDVIGIGHHELVVRGDRIEDYVDDGAVTLAASGVRVAIGEHCLVDEVGFVLGERSMLGVVGPSGAGKSSLLSAVGGLRALEGGHVLYEGRDLHADFAELSSRIGFVPQADLLHDGLTVRATLDYSARLRFPSDVDTDERTQRIDAVLDELGIAHRSSNRISELSGGERKRVNVATELLTRPSLLLLDEPASGLDAGLERTLMRLLRELADHDHTVVVVTHELDSLGLCDQVLVLAPGGVPAYIGRPDGLDDRFGHGDLVETFHQLGSRPDQEWRDPNADTTVAGVSEPAETPPTASHTGVRQWVRHVRTLTRRTLSVIASDRRNFALLVLQAPILGAIMLFALPPDELSKPALTQVRFVSAASLTLFVILLGATWLGANNAIRELARERTLIARELAVGIPASAQVTAKALVLGGLTAAQAVVLVAIASARQGGPTDAVVLGWPLGELALVVALTGIASMALALLVSAVVSSPDQATTLLPIVLILQFVLSAGGVLPELVDKPVLREMSAASSAQWGFAGAASTTDLNGLQEFTDQLRDLRVVDAADPKAAIEALSEPARPEGRWAAERSSWLTAVGWLIALTVLPLLAAVFALRRSVRR
ncbi:MAG TPA: FHA domain-containing protein [Acidimicrobiales bacterium]|nr:FHA domain-containing protein [Acidimicrobiales bacterium]